jgi:hypothetical protein
MQTLVPSDIEDHQKRFGLGHEPFRQAWSLDTTGWPTNDTGQLERTRTRSWYQLRPSTLQVDSPNTSITAIAKSTQIPSSRLLSDVFFLVACPSLHISLRPTSSGQAKPGFGSATIASMRQMPRCANTTIVGETGRDAVVQGCHYWHIPHRIGSVMNRQFNPNWSSG